ncbi:uncharacterized protein LOC102079562 isoform X2 [Oreochromis niloticus]|uniref:uncharacterized protein LOC102079562 isoform X2 n=1 Tax=Oreochromis niloticus TaxID=8128 RepID=UPI000DF140DC|nr:uncharacterized protein LOC102079562 isoform X2 [Oreochromis niloticus]
MTVERTASLVFFTLLVGGLLISADQKIISSEAGQNVTLTCQAPNNSILVVEWKRANLDEYGLLYRDGRLYPANQHTSFKNRVELQDIELKHGDVSLILKNVMITDSGTYKCFVVMEIGNNNKSPIITINLNITDPPASDQQIFRQAGMSVNLTFLVPTGTTSVWLKRLEKYKDNEKYISYCKDLTPTHPNDQEESFKGRVEGMDCSNISGTVSVTLKNLTRNDSGTYEFHGVDHGGRYFNKTVFLNVTDPGETGLFTTLPPLGIPPGGRSTKLNGTINLKSFPYYRDCLFNMSYHGDIT